MVCVHVCMCECVRVCGVCACVHKEQLWRAEDNLQEAVLSFHQVGRRDCTQTIELGHKYLPRLSYTVSPRRIILMTEKYHTKVPLGFS